MVTKPEYTRTRISWIHPSYRDLIIEELTLNKDLRSIFLRYMSIEGIKLAISDAGGERGERSLPFMANDDSWNLLQQRCEEIAEKSEPHETKELLTILADITRHFKKNISETRLPKVITGVCQSLLGRWDENKHIISSHELLLYSKVSIVTEPLIQMPNLAYSWQVHTANFRDWLGKGKEEGYIEDYIEFEEWVEFADSVKIAEPRFLQQVGFPHRYKNEIEELIDLIDSELQVDLSGEQFDLLISEAEKLDVLSFSLGTLQNLYPERRHRLSVLVSAVERTRDEWENEAGEQGPPFIEIDDDYERSTPPPDSFDIDIFFEDL